MTPKYPFSWEKLPIVCLLQNNDFMWSKIKAELCKQMGSSGSISSSVQRLKYTSKIPCLPLATFPGAAFFPVAERVCKAPGTQIY